MVKIEKKLDLIELAFSDAISLAQNPATTLDELKEAVSDMQAVQPFIDNVRNTLEKLRTDLATAQGKLAVAAAQVHESVPMTDVASDEDLSIMKTENVAIKVEPKEEDHGSAVAMKEYIAVEASDENSTDGAGMVEEDFSKARLKALRSLLDNYVEDEKFLGIKLPDAFFNLTSSDQSLYCKTPWSATAYKTGIPAGWTIKKTTGIWATPTQSWQYYDEYGKWYRSSVCNKALETGVCQKPNCKFFHPIDKWEHIDAVLERNNTLYDLAQKVERGQVNASVLEKYLKASKSDNTAATSTTDPSHEVTHPPIKPEQTYYSPPVPVMPAAQPSDNTPQVTAALTPAPALIGSNASREGNTPSSPPPQALPKNKPSPRFIGVAPGLKSSRWAPK